MAVYAKDKRRHRKSKIIINMILVLVILAIGWLLLITELFSDEKELIGTMKPINEEEQQQNPIPEEKTPDKIVDVSSIPETRGGYKVLGELVIEKLGVDKNILDTCTKQSLNISVTKFYGPGVNEPGNLVLCGHNWGDQNMGRYVKKFIKDARRRYLLHN